MYRAQLLALVGVQPEVDRRRHFLSFTSKVFDLPHGWDRSSRLGFLLLLLLLLSADIVL